MKTFAHVPETPITEEWNWQTDVQVTDSGSEVRISLRDEPKRSISANHIFGDDAEYREARNVALAGFEQPFLIPFYQDARRLTADANAGAGGLALNSARAQLRAGAPAMLFDRTGRREAVTVQTVLPGGITLAAPLAGGWRKASGATIAPLWPCYVGNSANFNRKPLSGGSLSLSATDAGFMVPFLNPLNTAVVASFSGLPLFPWNSIGNEFDEGLSFGTTVVDYGGLPYFRVPWKHSQFVYSRQFLVNRAWDFERWQWWQAFADLCKGSAHAFYMPTFRQDFEVDALTLNSVTFKGISYADDFFPFEAFKAFAFFEEDGTVTYAKATGVEKITGERTLVHLSSNIPFGSITGVSLLLKCRLSDDKISCEHTALQTKVTINIRTVDE